MEHDGLRAILADIDAGKLDGARLALRDYLTGAHDAPSHEVRYVLGRVCFDADKATARYLFEEALALKADFAEAGKYEARCGSALEDLESFRDDRHPACETCGLHYRDHEPLCPYCGSAVAPLRDDNDDSIEAQLRHAGQDVVDSIRTFGEREDVQQAKEKVVHAGQQAYGKAKEMAESEKAQELKKKAQKMGQKTVAKAKELSERKEVKDAAKRASALGKDAMDKARAFGERDDVKKAVGQAQETSKNFFHKVQDFAKAEQARISAAEGPEKTKLIVKWVVIGVVVLVVLRWFFGGN
ncbi:MAG: hypothetical protein L3K26_07665 [Candidatus Hydrogenedentes bacterium]|nr:hypothetical protein [Candidatus Hydrogenedentota bacterium]